MVTHATSHEADAVKTVAKAKSGNWFGMASSLNSMSKKMGHHLSDEIGNELAASSSDHDVFNNLKRRTGFAKFAHLCM